MFRYIARKWKAFVDSRDFPLKKSGFMMWSLPVLKCSVKKGLRFSSRIQDKLSLESPTVNSNYKTIYVKS